MKRGEVRLNIKYKDFYHHMIQANTAVTIMDNNFKEIYSGKAFLIEDDVWNKIKEWMVASAGLASDTPEFIIMLINPKTK